MQIVLFRCTIVSFSKTLRGENRLNKYKYLIVESSVLPEVFQKVVEAKELIAKNIAKSSSHACELVGLSRSTFYRYKDCVEVYNADSHSTITLNISLADKPGVLASVLDFLRNNGANILTINQNMPVNGVAPVFISMRDNSVSHGISSTIDSIKKLDGVVNAKFI